MQNERKQRQEIEALAGEFGVRVAWAYTHKGHIRATFQADTKVAALVMAKGHGGDWRSRHNNISRARRQLRELTA